MKILFAALLTIAATFAHAQVVETPCGPVPPNTTWTPVPFQPFSCAPDSVVNSWVRWNTAGAVAWWSCKKADGTVGKNQAAVTRERLLETTLSAEVSAALTGPEEERFQKLRAIGAAYADTAWNDPKLAAVWCPYQVELRDFLVGAAPPPPPPPPPPVAAYKVAKFGLSLTRPGYPMTCTISAAGTPICTRSTSSNQRATVGAACDCKYQSLEGVSRYCAFTVAPAPIAAALCEASK